MHTNHFILIIWIANNRDHKNKNVKGKSKREQRRENLHSSTHKKLIKTSGFFWFICPHLYYYQRLFIAECRVEPRGSTQNVDIHKVEKGREYFQKRRREDRAEEDVKVKRRKKENKSRVNKKIEKQLILDEIEVWREDWKKRRRRSKRWRNRSKKWRRRIKY